MKLITEKGELPLPSDFSFEIEVNNPFFSDEGTASVPATIPAIGNVFRILSHPERPGRSKRHIRTVPAMLQHGMFQRKCNMMVDSCSRDEGISVSLAFTESELYTSVKDRQLKELFAEVYGGTEYSGSIADMAEGLYGIYRFSLPSASGWRADIRIFPVAVEKNDDSGQAAFSVVNEPGSAGFVYGARTITSGGENVYVPEGYGVTPFLLLHRLIALTFELCGYKVVRNDFSREPFASIVVLNNCSDTICKGNGLCYRDLVPSMTVGDLITWLKDRFGAAVMVRHDRASIVMIQDALAEDPDMELTSQCRNSPVLAYPASSRVVLSCSTDLDSAEPVAETLPKLRERHRVLPALSIKGNPGVNCMVFRKPLGKYYTVSGYYNGGYKETLAGSNCFTYDRDNSDNTEEHSAEDRFVPEVYHADSLLMPYIGDRLHYNTNIAGESEEEQQPLQICYAFWDRNAGAWFGSTQPYAKDGEKMKYSVYSSQLSPAVSYPYPSLTPDGLYKVCWETYNNLLLNSAPEIEAQIDFTVEQLLSLDLMRPKLFAGQKVILKSLSYEVGSHGVKCGKSRLQLLANYADGIIDEDVTFEGIAFVWKLVNDMSEAIDNSLKPWEDMEIKGYDNMQDYTADDAPTYIPDRKNIIEKKRERYVVLSVFDSQFGSPETGQSRNVYYSEYFISI